MSIEALIQAEEQKFSTQWDGLKIGLQFEFNAMPLLSIDSPEMHSDVYRHLLKNAEEGSAPDQALLGAAYIQGCLDSFLPISHDFYNGIYWSVQAAVQENSSAQILLGIAFSSGKGVSKNSLNAWTCFYAAARNDNPKGQMLLAQAYLQTLPSTQGKKLYHYWMKKAAELSDPLAQYETGKDYLTGTGCKRNPKLSIEWIERAAANRQPDAMVTLGIRYADGLDTPKDLEKAKTFLQGAADQHHPEGMYELAKLLCEQGSPQEQKRGMCLMEAAAETGFPAALNRMGVHYIKDPKTADKAVRMYLQAAEQGYAPAQANLGDLYCYGKSGISPDPTKALYWSEQAAQQGCDEAQNSLALMYVDGVGGIPPECAPRNHGKTECSSQSSTIPREKEICFRPCVCVFREAFRRFSTEATSTREEQEPRE